MNAAGNSKSGSVTVLWRWNRPKPSSRASPLLAFLRKTELLRRVKEINVWLKQGTGIGKKPKILPQPGCRQNSVGKIQSYCDPDRHSYNFCPKYHHLKTKLSRWALGKSRRNC
ncbi:hypothetical protein QUA70_01770 [Microcoleus sp. LAD1_D5]|uniref:hypothetical protein n=1 Tax=unclassified Microcoleus TaxID=2642155 RepID=UPI002FCFB180